MTQETERFRSFTVDLGYVVMSNGDIVTSDGKPREIDEMQLRMAQDIAGHPLEFRFRAPQPDEIDDLRAQGIIP